MPFRSIVAEVKEVQGTIQLRETAAERNVLSELDSFTIRILPGQLANLEGVYTG